MNSLGDDLLDLDFDPDLLIQLLGNLSLDSIPADVSDTLSALENRNAEKECNSQVDSVLKKDSDVSQNATSSSLLQEESKSNCLPAIKSSEALDNQEQTDSLPQCTVSDEHNTLKCGVECEQKQNVSSNLSVTVKQQQNEIKSDQKAASCETSNYEQGVPSWFSVDSLTRKSFSYYPSYREQGKVFDIQLGDINSIKSELDKLPFLSSDNYQESSQSDHVSKQECDSNDSSNESLILLNPNLESTSKSSTNVDSGYDTSSTKSPSPPLLNTKTTDSTEHFDESSDAGLESIIATIVEVENSLLLLEASPSSTNIPVLKDAKNEDDQKERLLNFLKEPASVDSVQVSVIVSSDENSSPLGTFEESFSRSIARALNLNINQKFSHSTRKTPLKAKDKILGYELKYASKNDNGQLVVFTKGRHFERNKILKQIQDDEKRTQKKIKFIQIIDKRIKRTATDDQENNIKRRRLLSPKEEIKLKEALLKFEQ